ncbi:MAG: MarR family transcriptional regulator [Kineosporiaceae bacterium]|nr:MarR family transcriptional regulator [Aeromicrobium sp.]
MAGLDFDPIAEAARQWGARWSAVEEMHTVTSIMRAQQLLIARLDALLKPHDLTFSRYEALVLLTFSRGGQLPMGKMGERLQVHATSVSSLIQRLQASGFVTRVQHPDDGRTFLAGITAKGREVVERATADLTADKFGIGALGPAQLAEISADLRVLRQSAGDF